VWTTRHNFSSSFITSDKLFDYELKFYSEFQFYRRVRDLNNARQNFDRRKLLRICRVIPTGSSIIINLRNLHILLTSNIKHICRLECQFGVGRLARITKSWKKNENTEHGKILKWYCNLQLNNIIDEKWAHATRHVNIQMKIFKMFTRLSRTLIVIQFVSRNSRHPGRWFHTVQWITCRLENVFPIVDSKKSYSSRLEYQFVA
jgi:hypothetical protein